MKHGQWIMIIVPRFDTARNLVSRLRESSGIPVSLAHRSQGINASHTGVWVITSGYLLDLLAKDGEHSLIQGLRLVVCEDLDLLDSTYELALSRLLLATQTKPTRIVGFAAALNDAAALSNWLGVPPEGLYCFPPTERDQALSTTFQTFNIPYSTALMKAMVKPVYDSIRSLAPGESAIIFVPSVGQCTSVTAELVTQCAVAMNMRGFLGEDVSTETLGVYAGQLRDGTLADGVMRGIGMWHGRLDAGDKMLILRLYAEGVLRVLIIPRELCWNAPVRAGLVIVMGTQYTVSATSPDEKTGKRGERHVVEYTLHELIRMQGRAVRHGKTGRFHILCQAELREAYMRFLTDGIPLESRLLEDETGENTGSELLKNWVREQRLKQHMKSPQDVMDFLSSTFLARRLEYNPTYYDVRGDRAAYLSEIVTNLWAQGAAIQADA